MEFRELNEEESRVILNKGTEMPFTGEYNSFYETGTYSCKRCGSKLYNSSSKFDSGCGWPSFDDEIDGAIKRVTDADGRRVEILCNNCNAHLGHVFEGEQLTPKNTRHCVNSISLLFEPIDTQTTASAYFAGGCFWGVEYYFEELDGVFEAVSGYMGGESSDPTYKEICKGNSGHLEVVKVVYDPSTISYETLAKLFFEIHDPTQKDGQGPDIGSQYLSAVFYSSDEEKRALQRLIDMLKKRGFDVATSLIDASKHPFHKAEEYHQDYYFKINKVPYCHTRVKRF